jgi:lysophospholipase L1-like esterase
MTSKYKLHSDLTLLFQGNSITDAGRERSDFRPNSSPGLGSGYPALIAQHILESYPDFQLQCYNRGCSGDGLADLHRRWTRDTLPLLPDWISILIGVNDCWRYCSQTGGGSPEIFQDSFRRLIQASQEALPFSRLILCQPFLLEVSPVEREWTADMKQRQLAVQALAEEFELLLVPFQSALNQAALIHPPEQLLEDGIHPTPLGHRLLADCWLDTLGLT